MNKILSAHYHRKYCTLQFLFVCSLFINEMFTYTLNLKICFNITQHFIFNSCTHANFFTFSRRVRKNRVFIFTRDASSHLYILLDLF